MHLTRNSRLAAALGLLAATAAAWAARSGELRPWPDGPIRYIIGNAEAKAFKALPDDFARLAFIERFWVRRDPTPGTLANEYRQTFWERVRTANLQFKTTTTPGWKTDRGKIFILFGPPNDVRDDLDFSVSADPDAKRGLIRWFYSGEGEHRASAGPATVVPFVRDHDGEYRLSSDPKLSSIFFDPGDMNNDRPQEPWERWYADVMKPYGSELSALMDLGRLQEIPSQETLLLEAVSTSESFATHRLPVTLQRYRHPSDGSPLVVLTAAVPGMEAVPPVLARFTSRDAARAPVILGEGSFRAEGTGMGRVVQARTALAPGTWDLLVIAAGVDSASTGVARQTVVASPPAPALSLSDPVLLQDLAPLPYRSLISHDEPFVLGPYRAVPRTAPVLGRGEPLRLLYEIYGGSGPFHVVHRLEGKEKDGSWKLLGSPQEQTSADRVQAWEVPTSPRWPVAEYRVHVDVQDARGASAVTDAFFSLRADTP
jgi:GWxTD domain-containing protein